MCVSLKVHIRTYVCTYMRTYTFPPATDPGEQQHASAQTECPPSISRCPGWSERCSRSPSRVVGLVVWPGGGCGTVEGEG